MSYFDENNLDRVRWRCALNLEKYFEKPLRGFYNKEHEYVATWYENRLSLDKSKTLVEVTFINLTKPTYINKNTRKNARVSLLLSYLSITYIKFHSVAFGKKVNRSISSNLKNLKLPFQKVKG